MAALAASAYPVIAADLGAEKRAFAKKLGVHRAINPTEDSAADRVREPTGGGLDVAVELAGASAALRFSCDVVKRGGIAVTVGPPYPADELAIPTTQLTVNEKKLRPAHEGPCAPLHTRRDRPCSEQLMEGGAMPIAPPVTQRIALDESSGGFQRVVADGRFDRQSASTTIHDEGGT